MRPELGGTVVRLKLVVQGAWSIGKARERLDRKLELVSLGLLVIRRS